MKRTLLLLCLTAISSLPAMAVKWFIGFEGGYNYNDYSIETNYAYDMRYRGAGGISAGIPVRLDVVDWFAVRMDLQYLQKNHTMHRTHSYEGIYTNTCNHYLQLPIRLDFSFGGERVRGYVGVGGYVGCWLASHREGTTVSATNLPIGFLGGGYYDFNEYRELDTKHDNRFDSGLAGTLGIQVKIDERMSFFAETEFFYGLISTEKTKDLIAPTPRYNTTYSLQVGLLFSLDRQDYIKHKKSKEQ